VTAQDWDGPSFQTIANAALVTKRFEGSRRREVLSFKHHAEVAALPAEQADALLDAAEAEELKPNGAPETHRDVGKCAEPDASAALRRELRLPLQPGRVDCGLHSRRHP